MENEVSLYFREIMEKAGMDYIPDSGVSYHKTLKFSSVLNIEERSRAISEGARGNNQN